MFLTGLKIAVTIPPRSWFGSVDHKFAIDMAVALREMGAAVLEIDTARLFLRDPVCVSEVLSDLRRFKPDLALATPNAGYALLCNDLDGRNLFRDILQIPTALLWDHGALQFSNLVLGPLAERPELSREACIGRMREALDHPLWIHYSPDRGHTRVMRELGILVDQPVHEFLHIAFPAYTRPVAFSADKNAPQVAFAGNLYLDAARKLRFRENKVLACLENGMLAGKAAQPEASLWSLLLDEIGRLEEPVRRDLRLFPDSSFFWRFLRDEIAFVGTAHIRLNMLRSIRRDVAFFGNFVEPQTRAPLAECYGLRMGRVLDCVTELPWLYRNARILVDAVNPGYISGVSPKISSCFAAGGLILFDYRPEFREALGDVADGVMYRDTEHLNALIDEYLGAPSKRDEIADEIQARVLGGFTFAHLMRRILVEEPVWRGARAARA